MSLALDFGKMMAQRSLVQQQIPLRAQVAWARILDSPTDIQFTRSGRALDPQTLRITYSDTRYSDVGSDAGRGSEKYVILFGIRGHPDFDDTDIEEWDVFQFENQEYTVYSVNRQLAGEIQAEAIAV